MKVRNLFYTAFLILVIILIGGCKGGGGKDPTIPDNGDDDMSQPARWTSTPSTIPVPAGRQVTNLNRVGCFQKIALEHEDGRTFVVTATESAGAPGTVLRLAVSESVDTEKTWSGGAGDYNVAVETTIANGYDANEINQLREWSADIRKDTVADL